MRAVVLGAGGAVGREVSAGLAGTGVFDELLLADRDLRRLREVGPSLGDGASIRRVDAADGAALRAAIRGARVLVNCTTYHLGVAILEAAIDQRVDYIDLGGLYNTPRQLRLHARARRAGIRAVIGCGATPGLSNVLVRGAADRLDECHEVHISFASHRDLAPSPGLLDTILDEFRPGVPRYTWRGGRLEPIEPFDGSRRVRFPRPIGVQEVYYVPHSETYTLPRSLGPELREVAVRGTWRPSDMRALRTLARLGLTSERPIRVNGSPVRPLDVLRAVLLADPPSEADGSWAFFLDVEVVGTSGGRRAVLRRRASHPLEWSTAATGRMTAVPAVVGARMIAADEVGSIGVLPPEAAFEPARFVTGVRRAGVRIDTSTERGD